MRAPDHVARDGEAVAADLEHDVGGEDPEHADEAHEQERGLQQADAEDRGQLAQVQGVLGDALVGIDADLAGEAQQVGALGREPLVEQIVRQPFAQPDRDHLLQPGLGHDQHEQAAGDDQEDQKLGGEGRHVPSARSRRRTRPASCSAGSARPRSGRRRGRCRPPAGRPSADAREARSARHKVLKLRQQPVGRHALPSARPQPVAGAIPLGAVMAFPLARP